MFAWKYCLAPALNLDLLNGFALIVLLNVPMRVRSLNETGNGSLIVKGFSVKTSEFMDIFMVSNN